MPLRAVLICVSLTSAAAVTGCAPPVVTVEVLPPRSGVSCSAPGPDDAALGRGLFDAKASEIAHGSYVADLRVVVSGADARVDGVSVAVTRDGDDGDDDVGSFDNVPTGDVRLVGEGDDVRKAVVENVELLPRSVAELLAADVKVTELEFATLVLDISPVLAALDGGLQAESSTFAIDVCNGCLVDEPDAEECPTGTVRNPVCRVGQQDELFACAPAGLPPGIP